MHDERGGGSSSTRAGDWSGGEQSGDDWLEDVGSVDWDDTPTGAGRTWEAEGLAASDAGGGSQYEYEAGEAHRATIERRRLVAALVALVLVGAGIALAVVLFRGGDEGTTSTPTTTSAVETTPAQTPTTSVPTQTTTTPGTTTPSTTTPGTTPPTVVLPASGKLRLGDTSTAEITQVQQALIDLGYEPGNADGVFGPATQAAVMEFQQAQGLDPDGVVGQETATALNEALAAQSG